MMLLNALVKDQGCVIYSKATKQFAIRNSEAPTPIWLALNNFTILKPLLKLQSDTKDAVLWVLSDEAIRKLQAI
jgi:hypothetical protein